MVHNLNCKPLDDCYFYLHFWLSTTDLMKIFNFEITANFFHYSVYLQAFLNNKTIPILFLIFNIPNGCCFIWLIMMELDTYFSLKICLNYALVNEQLFYSWFSFPSLAFNVYFLMFLRRCSFLFFTRLVVFT